MILREICNLIWKNQLHTSVKKQSIKIRIVSEIILVALDVDEPCQFIGGQKEADQD